MFFSTVKWTTSGKPTVVHLRLDLPYNGLQIAGAAKCLNVYNEGLYNFSRKIKLQFSTGIIVLEFSGICFLANLVIGQAKTSFPL